MVKVDCRQMTIASVLAYTFTLTDKDAPSFFFLRGIAAVRAFNQALRNVTG